MELPKVSVIISTKNEEKNIKNCIRSIKNQTYPSEKIELIVVDNSSNDRTKEIARKFTKKLYSIEKEVDLSKVKNFRGTQLNFGVEKSSGTIIFFPDADMTFDEDIIEEAVNLLKKYDALYVPEVVIGKGFFGKIRNFERSFYNQTCIDAVRFVKRDLFFRVGGFDEKNIVFGPDDWDFTKRVKNETSKLSITESNIFHHEEHLNYKTYLEKKKKYANNFEGYIQKWEKDDKEVKKQLSPYYRLLGVFVENGKWRNLIKNPILTMCMFFIRLNVAVNYLMNILQNNNRVRENENI
ncbi:MAG: glycosyltransferase [Candidatus Cloacimonetes bacterium]|nr:glycosyltransferase [Candidatus Cloacimonadota bacterium]